MNGCMVYEVTLWMSKQFLDNTNCHSNETRTFILRILTEIVIAKKLKKSDILLDALIIMVNCLQLKPLIRNSYL